MLNEKIKNGLLDGLFSELYPGDDINLQKQRYLRAIYEFENYFGKRDNKIIISAPGRTEIAGNHTDHNNGKVLAGSVSLDVVGVVAPNGSDQIIIKSEGFNIDQISINELDIKEGENEKSIALIRGVCRHLKDSGYKIGGFEAYVVSNVPEGSGLSSSAAFEIFVGSAISYSFNNGSIDAVQVAKSAQYAEKEFFGKPCGLMDQMASSFGGIISIDFEDEPKIEKLYFDFSKHGYAICIVNTGGSHANLTYDYAAVPEEMRSVAGFFGKKNLRELKKEDIFENLELIRKNFGDRAILRSLHFFDENDRADRALKALQHAVKTDDIGEFLNCISESGNSSFKYLQNVYSPTNPREQGIALGLYVAEGILKGRGACRVHGGGFAGTTQNFVPIDLVDEFSKKMEQVFGKGSCQRLSIRKYGGIMID